MSAYLIDTDWAIHYLAGRPDVVGALDGLGRGTLFVSVITLAELYDGAFGGRNTDRHLSGIDGFLSFAAVLGLDEGTARLFGELRSTLRREGRLIDSFDILIAATCLQHEFRLLTNNVRHFERIEGLEIGFEAP